MKSTDPAPPVRRIRCGFCGAAFDCGANAGEGACWCATAPPLPRSAGAEGDCLCPTCLGERIAAATALGTGS